MAHTAAEIMDPEFFHASPIDPVGQLLQEMEALDLVSVPVLDLEGHPLGVANLHDIDRCRRTDSLLEHLREPAVSVRPSADIQTAARTLVEHGTDCLIVVDDDGVAVGAVRARELLMALLDAQTAPRALHSTGRWSMEASLEVEAVHRAPPLPGVFVLDFISEHGSSIVWAEAAQNLRERLDEILRLPQQDEDLEALLSAYPRQLTFRTITVSDSARRRRMLEALRTVVKHGTH